MSVPPTFEKPLVCTLALDLTSSVRLDAWRARWFPAERNFLDAHLTLFHALPDEEPVLDVLRASCARSPALAVRFARLQRTPRGVFVRAESSALRHLHDRLRGDLLAELGSRMTNQDRQGLSPHVTLVNKAGPEDVALAGAAIGAEFASWDGSGYGIAVWPYAGGPWEPVLCFPFSGTSVSGADG